MNSKKLNINTIFLFILSVGIICLGILATITFKTEKNNEFESWKDEKIRESSSNTSSYYSSLTTKIVLEKNEEIEKFLRVSKKSEGLSSIEIISPKNISSKILGTCVVNENQSFFNQVPACYEIKNESLIIYHELRSFGYNLGYLKKEIKLNKLIFKNMKRSILNFTVLILVFFIVNIATLFLLRKFIIIPMIDLSQSIKETSKTKKKFIIKEMQNIYESIKKAFGEVEEYQEKVKKMEIEATLGALSKQLSHDIRSPLAALKVVRDLGANKMDKDHAKLLTMSIDRITDIANTILPKKPSQAENKEQIQSSFLWMLVDQIISEKRVEYKNSNDVSIDFKFEGSPFELNASCNPTEFMRSISNIINNSIEAKDPERKLTVSVQLKSANDHITLTIADNGKGISSEILPKIFDEGFSHKKSHGTGLGLYQVKKAVESWNGAIQISSIPDRETVITIQLRKTPQPSWLATSIQISSYKNMIVLDDEEYVFSILQDRFEKHFKEIQYFKRIDEFEENIMSFSESFIFVDHDLKQNMTGIDLIEKYYLQKQSILLTGNYDDKQVQQRSAELGIKILPKPLINDLPILV